MKINPSQTAELIGQTIIESVSPLKMLQTALFDSHDDLLIINGLRDSYTLDLSAFRRIHLWAAGKAAFAMVEGALNALSQLSRKPDTCMMAVDRRQSWNASFWQQQGAEIFAASHPLPDEESLRAGQSMLDMAKKMQRDDLVIFLISGGASSLLELPRTGLQLTDLRQSYQNLLQSGASIHAINTVRCELSQIKGGKLAEAIAPASLLTLALSDVSGDVLTSIGSGPTMLSPQQNFRLKNSAREKQIFYGATVIGSNKSVLQSLLSALRTMGLDGQILKTDFSGSVESAADELAQVAMNLSPMQAVIFAGEATVSQIQGQSGGRCQHLCLELLQRLPLKKNLWIYSIASDGQDGNSQAAGAFLNSMISRDGLEEAIVSRSSSNWLNQHGVLIPAAPSGGNVMDITVIYSLSDG